MTGLAIGGLAASAIGTGVGVYSTYMGAQSAAALQEAQAAEALRMAQAQSDLAAAQVAAYNAQAGEYARQASVEKKLAGADQIQGELEAEKRSRALAAEIGSTYANAAGNGVIVDSASPTDTFAAVLQNEAKEAAYDVSIIRDNTAMAVWQRGESARKLNFAAKQARAAAAQAAMSGQEYLRQGASAYRMGMSQADATRSGGLLSALGLGMSGAGNLAVGGVTSYKKGLFS